MASQEEDDEEGGMVPIVHDDDIKIDIAWEGLYWAPSVAKATSFLSQQLIQAKQNYHRAVKSPFLSTMQDWLLVARILVEDWEKEERGKRRKAF